MRLFQINGLNCILLFTLKFIKLLIFSADLNHFVSSSGGLATAVDKTGMFLYVLFRVICVLNHFISSYSTTSSFNTRLWQIRNTYYHCDIAYNQLPTSQLSLINRAIFIPVMY